MQPLQFNTGLFVFGYIGGHMDALQTVTQLSSLLLGEGSMLEGCARFRRVCVELLHAVTQRSKARIVRALVTTVSHYLPGSTLHVTGARSSYPGKA